MKKTIVNIVILCSLGLITACSTTTIDEKPIDNYAIDFSSTTSRAAIQGDFPEGSSFSVWGWYVNQNFQTNNVFDNTEVKLTGGQWGYIGTQYWNPNCTYSFYAIHPFLKNVTVDNSSRIISLPEFDCTATGTAAVDLMTATMTVPYEGGTPEPVKLSFKHELVRVSFVAKTTESTAKVTSATLAGVSSKGSFAYNTKNTDNPVSWTNLSSETLFTNSNTVEVDMKGVSLFDEMLLPPQTIQNQSASLSINIDYGYQDGEKTQTGNLPAITLEAGKSYTFTLTIESDGRIHFGAPTISPWQSASGGIIIVE